jgi:hypothetical protein
LGQYHFFLRIKAASREAVIVEGFRRIVVKQSP